MIKSLKAVNLLLKIMLLLMANGNKSIEPLTDKFYFKPCSPNCEHQKLKNKEGWEA